MQYSGSRDMPSSPLLFRLLGSQNEESDASGSKSDGDPRTGNEDSTRPKKRRRRRKEAGLTIKKLKEAVEDMDATQILAHLREKSYPELVGELLPLSIRESKDASELLPEPPCFRSEICALKDAKGVAFGCELPVSLQRQSLPLRKTVSIRFSLSCGSTETTVEQRVFAISVPPKSNKIDSLRRSIGKSHVALAHGDKTTHSSVTFPIKLSRSDCQKLNAQLQLPPQLGGVPADEKVHFADLHVLSFATSTPTADAPYDYYWRLSSGTRAQQTSRIDLNLVLFRNSNARFIFALTERADSRLRLSKEISCDVLVPQMNKSSKSLSAVRLRRVSVSKTPFHFTGLTSAHALPMLSGSSAVGGLSSPPLALSGSGSLPVPIHASQPSLPIQRPRSAPSQYIALSVARPSPQMQALLNEYEDAISEVLNA
ncbi:MAG: hypothetical protein MHM6MM_000649 [Cercozoa sp. M6MM]